MEEIGLHELIQLAVHNGRDVSNLCVGSMILDQLIRLKHIGPNLASETDLLFFTDERGELLFLLFLLQLVESCAQNFHRAGFVLELRAFVLALHDDSTRQMCDADRGLNLVHILPAGAA